MDLKVYDKNGNWVRIPNAVSIEHAKQRAYAYAKLEGPLRVVELRVVEVPIGDEHVGQ